MMIESAVVLVFIILTVILADGRGRAPRLLWPITTGALLILAAAVAFWALVPSAGDTVRAPITAATIIVVALMIVNLLIERRRRGWRMN